MVPGGKDSGWEDMMPDSLGHMLEGCMFFRKEPAMEAELMELTVEPAGQTIEIGPAEPEDAQPAMEVELAGPAETEPAQPDPPPQPVRKPKRRWTLEN